MFQMGLRKIAYVIGIDKSIAYSSGARIIQGFSGVLVVFFIAQFLTEIEQGFYFTFGSILALQNFFELGFSGIITQYIAHECPYLNVGEQIGGDERHISRLASLLQFILKWYAVASLLCFLTLFLGGYIFFVLNSSYEEVSWRMPWLILTFASAVKFFQSPMSSFFMGLGKVKEMSRATFYQQISMPLTLCVGLALGLKLYVVGISSVISALIWFWEVGRCKFYKMIGQLIHVKVTERVSYMKEIFPYQWRIALSSMSGYFIFSFINPVLFAYQGAVLAGQVGMTITIINGIQGISVSWLNTKVPLYSSLIEIKDYLKLDTIFFRTMFQMIAICTMLMILAVLFIQGMSFYEFSYNGNMLSARFLTGMPLVILMLAYFADQFSYSWATYLRCHLKEPFLWISIVTGLLCLVTILITAKYFSIFEVVLGYCLAKYAVLPWGYYIFKSCKKEWHKD